MFDPYDSVTRECQVCKPRPQFRTVQDHGLTESLCKVTEPPGAGARLDFARRPLTDPSAMPQDSAAFPVTCTCAECGFSLTVTEDDTTTVPDGLSPQHQARIVLEDHGWSSADDPPLCSACST